MKATATITIKGVFDTADYAEPQEFVAELREAALHALEPHIDVQGSSVGIALNYSVSQGMGRNYSVSQGMGRQ